MKVSKIWSLLKKRRSIVVMEGKDCKWIGDGIAAYSITNLPVLDSGVMQTLLDVSDKAWDNFEYETREVAFDENDFVAGEVELKEMPISIWYKDMELILLEGSNKIFFVQSKYTEPIRDTEYLSFSYRPYDKAIVARNGMFMTAVICPVNLADTDFDKELYKIYKLMNPISEGADEDDNDRIP